MEQFLRNHDSQCLFWGKHAIRIGGSIPEESRFTIFLGNRATSSEDQVAW